MKLELGKELAETLMILILTVVFCVVVKYIDMKKSSTIHRIEQRLERMEKQTSVCNHRKQLNE